MSTAGARSRGLGPGDPAHRLEFLDVTRALAVLGMLVANLTNVFVAERPWWLSHNLGDELLPLDFAAPVFQFLIGVSLVLFLHKRRASPRVLGQARQARLLAARRMALLVLLGAVLDGVSAGRFEVRWGVLQTLGLGGLAATALADASDAVVLAVAVTILATHYGPGNNEVHRSALDCLPFVPLTLLGYVVGRPLAGAPPAAAFRKRALVALLACASLALALRVAGVPFNKVTGSGSFVALSGAASTALVLATYAMERRGVRFWNPLVVLGANALTAWVLQYVLVFYPVGWGWGNEPLFPQSSGLVVVAVATTAIAVLTLACARRGWRVPL